MVKAFKIDVIRSDYQKRICTNYDVFINFIHSNCFTYLNYYKESYNEYIVFKKDDVFIQYCIQTSYFEIKRSNISYNSKDVSNLQLGYNIIV